MNQFVACLTWPLWLAGVSLAGVSLAGVSLAGPPQYAYGPYNEGRMDPQVEGWPLTVEERAYVVGQCAGQRQPELCVARGVW